jgi:hypothetical protein
MGKPAAAGPKFARQSDISPREMASRGRGAPPLTGHFFRRTMARFASARAAAGRAKIPFDERRGQVSFPATWKHFVASV